MTGKELTDLLEDRGYDFFTGVPCSLLQEIIATLESHPKLPYLAAVREDAALGLAAGAWLGGRSPVVLMQNSGLGVSLNALASLSLLYQLPCLLLVSWRGYEGRDAPEHLLMGKISLHLLETLGVQHRVLQADCLEDVVEWAAAEMASRHEPVALLLPPNLLEAIGGSGAAPLRLEPSPRFWFPASESVSLDVPLPSLSRAQAVRTVVSCLGDEPVIHANGMICRESFAIQDRPQNFYMIGSMGLASSIALGVALCRPERMVVVFDADGNLLMNLGGLTMVGALHPRNYLHLVFDNEVYGSTGNQKSLSRHLRLDWMATAAGYCRTTCVTEVGDLEREVRTALGSDGPNFILVKVTTAEEQVPRVPFLPQAIRDRFRSWLLDGHD